MVRKSTPVQVGNKKRKKKTEAGSYIKSRRKGYEDMLKQAGE
jgi:hypothetical protein